VTAFPAHGGALFVNVQVSKSILDQEWREVSIVALAHSVIMASSYGWSANVDISHFPVKEFHYCSLMHLKQYCSTHMLSSSLQGVLYCPSMWKCISYCFFHFTNSWCGIDCRW